MTAIFGLGVWNFWLISRLFHSRIRLSSARSSRGAVEDCTPVPAAQQALSPPPLLLLLSSTSSKISASSRPLSPTRFTRKLEEDSISSTTSYVARSGRSPSSFNPLRPNFTPFHSSSIFSLSFFRSRDVCLVMVRT